MTDNGREALAERLHGVFPHSWAWAEEQADAILANGSAFVDAGELERLRAWVETRKARDKRSRDRYRVAHPEVHRKSARESMARTRALRAALAEQEPKP